MILGFPVGIKIITLTLVEMPAGRLTPGAENFRPGTPGISILELGPRGAEQRRCSGRVLVLLGSEAPAVCLAPDEQSFQSIGSNPGEAQDFEGVFGNVLKV